MQTALQGDPPCGGGRPEERVPYDCDDDPFSGYIGQLRWKDDLSRHQRHHDHDDDALGDHALPAEEVGKAGALRPERPRLRRAAGCDKVGSATSYFLLSEPP
jgi:hypothetical protein